MTKYKLSNAARAGAGAPEVTLTGYLADPPAGTNNAGPRKEVYHISMPEGEPQQPGAAARNTDAVRSCHVCPHSCQFLQPAASGWPPGGGGGGARGFGVNELRGERLAVCLCERYNGGCKLCPLPQLPVPVPEPAVPAHAQPQQACATCLKRKEGADEGGAGAGWRRATARRARACCSAKALRRRVPILDWLPRYTPRAALADLIAGVTVGLTVIPQAIAYAGVAGLPPQYGLYSSFMACFVYTVFGSVKDSAIGPTAIAAILTRENLHGLGPEFAVLLAFLSGCVELLMGILQLGFLIDFISGPVSVGFTSAAAIIIATTQVKDILGLSFPGGKFLQVWAGMYEHIGETRLWDSVLGVGCIGVLLLLRKVKDIKVCGGNGNGDGDSEGGGGGRWSIALAQALWFLSTTRNITVVLASAALAYYCDSPRHQPFRLTGDVKPGLPAFAPPPFSATVGNHTYSFAEMTSTLGSAIFVVPLLSILENIALAKVFSEGRAVDATQEMVALGLCNVASSLVQAMPVSGALSRGAVNHASDVRSPAGGLYTGALVLLSLQYLTPYFTYIPKAALAAVIIAAVVFMMELHVFRPIWRTRRLDVVPAAVTFAACLATRLELGIVVGICVNLAFLLYASARPRVRVSHALSPSGVAHTLAAVDRSLAFPSAEFVRRALSKAAARHGPAPLVIDATHVQAADFTAAKGIKSLIEDFAAGGQPLIFYNVRPAVASALRGVNTDFVHAASPQELDRLLRATVQPPTTKPSCACPIQPTIPPAIIIAICLPLS